MENGILHVDMNNFYASVETLFAPEYRDVPMAVGGDKESRHGIILAKNMLAKQYGVKTAEPIWQAMQKCPQLRICSPHHGRYREFSQKAKKIYYQYTDQVESFGLDECWLDVYGSERLFGDGEEIAQQIRRRVKEELGLTVSVGVSFNKSFAKLGSDYKKPDAVTVFGRADMEAMVWKLPVGALLFVGAQTERQLKGLGIYTIGDAARTNRKQLNQLLGKRGDLLWLHANGMDNSPVERLGQGSLAKTIGNSTTLPKDLTSEKEVRLVFLSLAESVARQLRDQGLKAGEVQITVRNSEFEEYQRQCRLEIPSWDSRSLYRAALTLYCRENKKWQVRLLGLRAGKLTGAGEGQLSFFDQSGGRQREEKLEAAMDQVRDRFGPKSLGRAMTLPAPKEKKGE